MLYISIFKKSKKVIGMALVIVIFCITTGCGTVSNHLVLSGTIEAKEYNICSEIAGKVVKINEDEGNEIKNGDLIAEIDNSSYKIAVEQSKAVVRVKQARLDELKALNNNARTKQKEKDLDYLEDILPWLLSKSNVKMSSSNNYLSSRIREEIRRSNNQNQVKQGKADLDQAKAVLKQAQLSLSRCSIKSLVAGICIDRLVNVGDIINTGSNIMTISDLADLSVKVYIPEKDLNAIKLGQEIQLASPVVPADIIKGQVVKVSNKAEFTPKNVETSEAKETTVFKVTIKILTHKDVLKPGMNVDANILLGG